MMGPNNTKAMRDVLEKMTDWMEKHTALFSVQVCPRKDDPAEVERERDECISLARTALTAPPRNCDIGTPSEQYKRFLKYCKKNTGGCDRADRYANPCAYCFSQWAQMPYNGETK